MRSASSASPPVAVARRWRPVQASTLRATEVGGREVPDLIDEIPVLAVAAAHAAGTTTFADAAELRVKETDRIATVTSELRSIGARVDRMRGATGRACRNSPEASSAEPHRHRRGASRAPIGDE